MLTKLYYHFIISMEKFFLKLYIYPKKSKNNSTIP